MSEHRIANEPVAVNAAVIGLATATLGVLSAFGIYTPTAEQSTAIFGLLTAVIAVGAWLTRRQTYGPVTVREAGKPSPEEILQGGGIAPSGGDGERGDAVTTVILLVFVLIIVLLLLGRI